MKKNCIRCKDFNKCVSSGFVNFDRKIDKRILRKFMREANFRYCKKFRKCSARQEKINIWGE